MCILPRYIYVAVCLLSAFVVGAFQGNKGTMAGTSKVNISIGKCR